MLNDLSIKTLKKFPVATKQDWNVAANSETKKTNSLDELSWKGPNDLTFLPYYDRSDIQFSTVPFQVCPAGLHDPRSWLNLPPIKVNDLSNFKEKVNRQINNGIDGFLLDIDTIIPACKTLLENVHQPFHVYFLLPENNLTTVQANELLQFCHDSRLTSVMLQWKKNNLLQERFLKEFKDQKNFLLLGLFIEEDENPIQEIANALDKGVQLLDQLTDNGHAAEDIINHIAFSFESGSDFFYSIAKLRAIRFLWQQIAHAYGIKNYHSNELSLHVRCKPWTDEKFQPHGNMLYGTTASLGAVIGGCNALSVHPEDENSAMAERIAKNISILLREESHINQVADPLAGSYLIESLTHSFSQEAWELFSKKFIYHEA